MGELQPVEEGAGPLRAGGRIDRDHRDLLPRRMGKDLRRFGIPANVELAARRIDEFAGELLGRRPFQHLMRGQAAAHIEDFLHIGGKAGVQALGDRDIGHRPGREQGDLARMRLHHPHQEGGGNLCARLRPGVADRQVGHLGRIGRSGMLLNRVARPVIGPWPLEHQPAILAFPALGRLGAVEQREGRARHHRHVGPAQYLQRPQRIGGRRVAPHRSAGGGDAQHLDIRALQQQQRHAVEADHVVIDDHQPLGACRRGGLGIAPLHAQHQRQRAQHDLHRPHCVKPPFRFVPPPVRTVSCAASIRRLNPTPLVILT